ncbi:MAG: hypothetical protein KatS3mg102_1934 [Planctomycetota bacterium]|nr:MAG: hypothetical protein KatS3mg102_1934 [Planctomycetota bacterium]
MRLMLTTVGTSALQHNASELERRRLAACANKKQVELDPSEQELLAQRRQHAEQLLQGPPRQVRRASAELNALLAYYGDRESAIGEDRHILVASDTAQGRLAAALLEAYLSSRAGPEQVEVWAPAGLVTSDLTAFYRGVRSLLKLCDETLPAYRLMGVPIVFNTVGGFKSQRDMLNVLGMFYADEILYIFEDPAAPLLRLPRLPVRLDRELFQAHAVEMALLAAGRSFAGQELRVPEWLPATLFDEPDAAGRRSLSAWGLLVWNQVKDEVLGEQLLGFDGVEYTAAFERDFFCLPQDPRRLRTRLQQRVAQLVVELERAGGQLEELVQQGLLERSGGRLRLVVAGEQRAAPLLAAICEPADAGGGLRFVEIEQLSPA